jgi:RND family efflux transporter MFP subunit
MKPLYPQIKILASRMAPILVVLAIGLTVVFSLYATKEEVEDQEEVIQPRIVRAVEAIPSSRQIKVISQGNVEPRVAIVLQAEVAGRIVEVSDNFVVGGFFKKGEVLIKIDPRDYELAVIRAEARVAEAVQRQRREKAEANQALKEWKELGTGEASPLVLREPQLLEAEARLKSAKADLAEARLRLERTQIRAPFDGRVTSKNFDIGQIVRPGVGASGIYALDRLEIRLPLTDRQIALLDLPLQSQVSSENFPKVTLETVFAGQVQKWSGQIIRTEGRIDTESRVLYAVARVNESLSAGPNGVPITVGMFVKAEIDGRFFDNVVSIPREAVRQDGTVLVVGTDSRLHFRPVEVLQATRDTSFVRLDVTADERICVSPIDTPTENMLVSVVGDDIAFGTNLAAEVTP